MKVLSTSNFESPKTDISLRLGKSGRGVLAESNSPGFALPQIEKDLGTDNSKEPVSLDELNGENLLVHEQPVPDIEHLVSAPVNADKLVEGYRLFGSMFDILQVKLTSEGRSKDYGQDFVDVQKDGVLLEFSAKTTSCLTRQKGELDSVVVDLSDARKWGKAERKIGRSETDHLFSVKNTAGLATTLKSQKRDRVELHDVTTTAVGSTAPRNTLLDLHQTEIAKQHSDLQLGTELQNRAEQGPHLSDVDQVVRAVAEHSDALSVARPSSSELLRRVSQTGQTLRLSLHPSELGCVEVSVSRRGKRLQVTIKPELESTARVLLKDVEKLVEKLGLANTSSERIHVHIASSDGRIEAGSGEQNMQLSARSDNEQETRGKQNATTRVAEVEQQDRSDGDESNNIRRKRADDGRRDRGGIYI